MTSDYTLSVNQTMTEPNPQSTLLIRVQSHNHRTQISSKVINVEVRLPPSHVTIHLETGPIPLRSACRHGNQGNAWSLFNKRGRTGARIPY